MAPNADSLTEVPIRDSLIEAFDRNSLIMAANADSLTEVPNRGYP